MTCLPAFVTYGYLSVGAYRIWVILFYIVIWDVLFGVPGFSDLDFVFMGRLFYWLSTFKFFYFVHLG